MSQKATACADSCRFAFTLNDEFCFQQCAQRLHYQSVITSTREQLVMHHSLRLLAALQLMLLLPVQTHL